jgi:excisionase family DNA binding protein
MPNANLKKKAVVMEMPTGKTIVEQIAERRSALSLKEFAEMTGISYNTAFDMATDGRLPVMRIGSSIRLDPKTTAQWLRERTSA